MQATIEQPGKARSMMPLFAMILVFALPMVIGWYLYLNPGLLSGTEKVNGQIIDPPRSISALSFYKESGEELNISELEGKWLLMFVLNGECDKACVNSVGEISRVERALGRNRSRVEKLLLMQNDQELKQLETLGTLNLASKDQQVPGKIITLLGAAKDRGIFVVDPMGNIMLGYDHDVEGIKILEDIKKLLTATKNWNKGCAVCPAIN